jgi:hypothetical protein
MWPDIDSDAFEVYRSWLYQRTIPPYRTNVELSARCIRLVKAHILAESLSDVDFRHAVRSAIVDDCAEIGLSTRTIAIAYKQTDGPCPVRDFLCHLYRCIGQSHSLDDKFMPQAFIRDLAKSRMSNSKTPASAAKVRQHMMTAGQLGPQHTFDRLLAYLHIASAYAPYGIQARRTKTRRRRLC